MEDNMPEWARRYLAARQTTDLARDPTDPKLTRQSAATIQGVLVPVSGIRDNLPLASLFRLYERGLAVAHTLKTKHPLGNGSFKNLTSTMIAMIERSAARNINPVPELKYLSLDPRDYTVYDVNHVDVPVISIHTRPERCWFLAVLDVDDDIIGLKLGRMRVGRVSDQGVYPITIRTHYRALTDRKKQEEVRDAYSRLIRSE
jgi:hypothetical protein